jgi:hypothetical protein
LNPAAQRPETIVPNAEHWQFRCYMPECERWETVTLTLTTPAAAGAILY